MRLSQTSTEQGAARKRRVRRAALLAATAATFGAVLFLPDARGLATQSDDFQLAALELKGLHRLTGDRVLEASGLAVGDNIFAVDLNAIAARLDSLVWIKAATIQRKPPDRLAFTIEERRRLAWIAAGGQTYGVDDEGVLLPGDPLSGETVADLDLPVITGAGGGATFSQGSITDSSLVRVVNWLKEANAVDSVFCRNFSQAEAMGRSDMRLRLVGDGLEVRLPGGNVSKWLPILKQVLATVYRDVQAPEFIDLRFSGQVVMGTRPQALESAGTSATTHSPRSKKGAGHV